MESPAAKRRKMDKTLYTPIYPSLPAEESPEQQAHSYRLQQISLLKCQLEDEHEKRAALYKKYHRGVNVIDGIDTTLVVASMGMGIGGTGLLCTIIAALIVLDLECASLACGLLEVSGKYISRRLAIKANTHNEIRVLIDNS